MKTLIALLIFASACHAQSSSSEIEQTKQRLHLRVVRVTLSGALCHAMLLVKERGREVQKHMPNPDPFAAASAVLIVDMHPQNTRVGDEMNVAAYPLKSGFYLRYALGINTVMADEKGQIKPPVQPSQILLEKTAFVATLRDISQTVEGSKAQMTFDAKVPRREEVILLGQLKGAGPFKLYETSREHVFATTMADALKTWQPVP